MILRRTVIENLTCARCGFHWGPDNEISLLGYQPRRAPSGGRGVLGRGDGESGESEQTLLYTHWPWVDDGPTEVYTYDEQHELIHRCPETDPGRDQLVALGPPSRLWAF